MSEIFWTSLTSWQLERKRELDPANGSRRRRRRGARHHRVRAGRILHGIGYDLDRRQFHHHQRHRGRAVDRQSRRGLSGDLRVEFRRGRAAKRRRADGFGQFHRNVGGFLYVDTGGQGGSQFSVGGTLTNNGTFNVGYSGLPTPATIDLDDFINSATASFQAATITVSGVLTNSSTLNVGASNQSAATTVETAALDNTGTVDITGNGAIQAALGITTAAPSALTTGTLDLSDDALLEFASGGITSISNGAELSLSGAGARVADAGNTATSSALSGLSDISGGVFANAPALGLHDGAQLTISAP